MCSPIKKNFAASHVARHTRCQEKRTAREILVRAGATHWDRNPESLFEDCLRITAKQVRTDPWSRENVGGYTVNTYVLWCECDPECLREICQSGLCGGIYRYRRRAAIRFHSCHVNNAAALRQPLHSLDCELCYAKCLTKVKGNLLLPQTGVGFSERQELDRPAHGVHQDIKPRRDLVKISKECLDRRYITSVDNACPEKAPPTSCALVAQRGDRVGVLVKDGHIHTCVAEGRCRRVPQPSSATGHDSDSAIELGQSLQITGHRRHPPTARVDCCPGFAR